MSKSILRKISVTIPLMGLAIMVSGCVVRPIGVATYSTYPGYQYAEPAPTIVVEPAPVFVPAPVYRPYGFYGHAPYHHWIR